MSENTDDINEPDWFNIKKYEYASTTDVIPWIWNLYQRISLLIMFRESNNAKKYCSARPNVINKLRSGGFIIEHDKFDPSLGILSSTVRSLSCLEVFHVLESPPEQLKMEMLKYLDNPYTLPFPAPNKDKDIDDFEAIDGIGSLHATININAPLKDLERDFKQWAIEQKKKHQCIRPSITEDKLREWRNARIIPYMDLLIWKMIEAEDIDNEHLGYFLVLDNNNLDPKEVVDVAEKKVNKLINWKFVEYLDYQINHK